MTENPGLGVAQSTSAPDAENEIAAVPPTSVKVWVVLLAVVGAGAVVGDAVVGGGAVGGGAVGDAVVGAPVAGEAVVGEAFAEAGPVVGVV